MKQKPYFPDEVLRKAAAIVRVFETGRATGDPAAVAVLDDGAGISYGISQFTHRSGSLARVVRRYLMSGAAAGRDVLAEHLPLLECRTRDAVSALAASERFRRALRAAGATPEMRAAQESTARERYIMPAVRFCGSEGFVLPLTLAVVCDAMTHGSFDRIRMRVRIPRGGLPAVRYEQAWTREFVMQRHTWLGSVARLRVTRYRTRFFLEEIAAGRWGLELPIHVHGAVITRDTLWPGTADAAADAAVEAAFVPGETRGNGPARPDALESVERRIDAAAQRFDRAERAARVVIDRTDRAKSLWTTIASTVWQTGWAVLSFLAGMPRELWLAVAVITAATMLFYLYRQITLGRIRENGRPS